MLIRYPGSKDKLAGPILAALPSEIRSGLESYASGWEYREPFFGAGAVGLRVLDWLPAHQKVWLNDKDRALVALWRAVCERPAALQGRVERFTPSVGAYREYQGIVAEGVGDVVDLGFAMLALHQMSYSGLGQRAGSPLGGWSQGNALYSIDCRWNPGLLSRHITRLHGILRKFPDLHITAGDFAPLLEDAETSFIYLDPPYWAKGPELYAHPFTEADHVRLAEALQRCEGRWLLSYDDAPEIRRLYQWASVQETAEVSYTIATRRVPQRKNREILVKAAV